MKKAIEDIISDLNTLDNKVKNGLNGINWEFNDFVLAKDYIDSIKYTLEGLVCILNINQTEPFPLPPQ